MHRDAEHAKGWHTRRLLSMAGATLPNKTNLCENCYNQIASTGNSTYTPRMSGGPAGVQAQRRCVPPICDQTRI
jgi:hypothetical protein